MVITVLKSKMHFPRITESNLYYEGSIGIDIEFIEKAGMYVYEKVLVTNVNNGLRWETYLIPEERYSKKIALNGTGARYGEIQDPIIIMSFTQIEEEKISSFIPKVLQFDENNKII